LNSLIDLGDTPLAAMRRPIDLPAAVG
jgi:hypothetical protein